MIFGHDTTSHDLAITGNTFAYDGCVQARGDHGGVAIMCPNGHAPSGVIEDNTFLTCPGGIGGIYVNPDVKDCAANLTITRNANNTIAMVEQPQVNINPVRERRGDRERERERACIPSLLPPPPSSSLSLLLSHTLRFSLRSTLLYTHTPPVPTHHRSHRTTRPISSRCPLSRARRRLELRCATRSTGPDQLLLHPWFLLKEWSSRGLGLILSSTAAASKKGWCLRSPTALSWSARSIAVVQTASPPLRCGPSSMASKLVREKRSFILRDGSSTRISWAGASPLLTSLWKSIFRGTVSYTSPLSHGLTSSKLKWHPMRTMVSTSHSLVISQRDSRRKGSMW